MLAITLLIIPILGALATLFAGTLKKQVAVGFSLLTLLVFVYALVQGQTISFNAVWIESLGINFNLSLSGIHLVLVGLTSVLVPLIVLSTSDNSKPELVLFAQAALMGVYMAQDIFLFYFFYEIALIPVYFIMINKGAAKAGFRMFIYTVFGSLLMLAALVYVYIVSQNSSINELMANANLFSKSEQYFIFWALFIAFSIKMPVFPFHAWQPNAYTDSPVEGTQLLSGLLSKMGLYGLLILLLPMAPLGVEAYKNMALILCLIGLIYGSLIAIRQDNIKTLLAYSSFAHMGLMAAGILSQTGVGLQGAIFQMVAHGLNIVGLFYVAHIIETKTGSLSLKTLGGLSQKAPKLTVLFVVLLLGSVALPLTNGFIGEFLLLKGLFDYHSLMGILAGLTIILGAVYMLRLLQNSFFNEANEITEAITDIQLKEMWVLVPLAILVILLGVYPQPILDVTEPIINPLIH